MHAGDRCCSDHFRSTLNSTHNPHDELRNVSYFFLYLSGFIVSILIYLIWTGVIKGSRFCAGIVIFQGRETKCCVSSCLFLYIISALSRRARNISSAFIALKFRLESDYWRWSCTTAVAIESFLSTSTCNKGRLVQPRVCGTRNWITPFWAVIVLTLRPRQHLSGRFPAGSSMWS